MALVDAVRAAVKAASNVVDSFKGTVTLQAWIGDDGEGTDEFASPVTLRAVINPSKHDINGTAGRVIQVVGIVAFLDPLENTDANSGKDRQNPIDPRDIITLPDGSTAPIQKIDLPYDAGKDAPFVVKVMLGNVVRGA